MILCHNDYFEKLVIYIWMAPLQKYEILHVENITQKKGMTNLFETYINKRRKDYLSEQSKSLKVQHTSP